MKKILAVLAVIAFASAVYAADTAIRVVEDPPATNGVLSIKIVEPSLIQSIYCDVTGSGLTNIYTIGYTSAAGETRPLAAAGDTVLTASAYTDSIVFFNYDADSSTGATEWLQPGDTFKITGTGSGFTNSTFRVVLKELRK